MLLLNVTLLSFFLLLGPYCGFKSNEVQSGAEIQEKGVGNKDDSFEGVTKVEDDGWDVAMKAMNKALGGTEYSQYKWVKNEGEDAKSRPLVIKMQPQTQP